MTGRRGLLAGVFDPDVTCLAGITLCAVGHRERKVCAVRPGEAVRIHQPHRRQLFKRCQAVAVCHGKGFRGGVGQRNGVGVHKPIRTGFGNIGNTAVTVSRRRQPV